MAKKSLKVGENLDGEGGYTVWRGIARAQDALNAEILPIGLAHGLKLKNAVPMGQVISWNDVEIVESQAITIRRKMERKYKGK